MKIGNPKEIGRKDTRPGGRLDMEKWLTFYNSPGRLTGRTRRPQVFKDLS